MIYNGLYWIKIRTSQLLRIAKKNIPFHRAKTKSFKEAQKPKSRK